MSVKGVADDGEGGDEAEEDGEDTCHCAQHSAHNTWKCKYYSTYSIGMVLTDYNLEKIQA